VKKKLLSILMIVCLLLTVATSVFAEDNNVSSIKGTLLIVGGALEATNAEVYNKFIELAGGKEKAVIGVIPAASSSPSKYYKQFVDELKTYGLDENQVLLIPIAVKDEKKTEVDESSWIENVDKQETVDIIKKCTGIWFVGGDQTRITKALFKADGSNTSSLDAVWDIYKAGAVIGGTSAGAAIMSEIMLGGGSSLGALNNGFTTEYVDSDQQEYGPAYIEKGLGFFQYGVVDQHFDRKARLGRLIVVGYAEKNKYPVAYGVDENTAMIVYNDTKKIEVAGKGGVTIVDFSKAEKDDRYEQTAMNNIMISYLETGDKYDMTSKKYEINPAKLDTKGYEYYEVPGPIINTGVLSPNGLWKKFIGFDLVDNYGIEEVKSYTFDAAGKGVELVFRKTEESNGWWAYLNGGTYDYYSVVNVALDIHPIKVEVNRVALEYTVQKGDMLWKIAEHFNTNVEKLVKLNKLANPNTIKIGQKLLLPQE
jgi:cyanophycinase